MKRLLFLLLLLAPFAFPQATTYSARRIQSGTTLPTACTVGAFTDVFIKTNAAVDQQEYVCTTGGNPGVWTQQGGGSPVVLPTTPNLIKGDNAGGAADSGILPANVVQASSPGAGVAHFAGSTQTVTSSSIVNADIANSTIDLTAKVTGVLPNANTTAASANTASAIVARDGSGNFSAGTITASLTGHASLDAALASNNTFTAGQIITQGTANQSLLDASGFSLTGSNNQPGVKISGTFNTSGAGADLVQINLTNTASGVGSSALNVNIGGNSTFLVDRFGNIRVNKGNGGGALQYENGGLGVAVWSGDTAGFNLVSPASLFLMSSVGVKDTALTRKTTNEALITDGSAQTYAKAAKLSAAPGGLVHTCGTYTLNNNGTNWTVAFNGGTAVVGAAIAASATQSVTLFALPARGKITDIITTKTTTAWSGTAFTTITSTIGDSVGGTTYYTSSPFENTAATSNTNYQDAVPLKSSASYAGSNVSVSLTANQNLNAQTITGITDFSVCWETIP